jgi:heme-binding NEAT domain protein
LTKLFKKTMAMLIAFVLLLFTIHIGPVSVANAATTVADGEYPISYRYVKNGTSETSAANYFMIKDTGKLVVSNGKAKLEHEIKKTTPPLRTLVRVLQVRIRQLSKKRRVKYP